MKILHYFLGFPPYRTGGLTKYAFDLMEAQVISGNEVVALWPGQIKKFGANPILKSRKDVREIKNFELINPLPVPLDEGITQFEAFVKSCDSNIYIRFLEQISPDVIHIHTLMGLHKEFIEAANTLQIRTVFTSHDYFGICPKVTLYRYGNCCDDDNRCKKCIQCNVGALSLRRIKIMQSPLYRTLKDSSIVKRLRRHHRGNFFAELAIPEMPEVDIEKTSEEYRKLRQYYVWMYEHIDFIHFNSTVAECVYKQHVIPKDSRVVSISHKGIKDNRDNTRIPSAKLRITYLAPAKPFKGFNVLTDALDELWNNGKKDFQLNVFSPVPSASPYMVVKEDGFSQSELNEIFSNTDLLVAPSVWYETFGFTVLEALSYGVPVIVSDHVGAKDVVGRQGVIIAANDKDSLKNAIMLFENHEVTPQGDADIKLWNTLCEETYQMYESCEDLK